MTRTLPWLLMTLLAIGIAGYALGNLVFPGFRSQFVENIYAVSPTAISMHLFGGCIAMVLGAFQVNSSLRKRYIAAHRWIGRIYVLAVLVGGVAGFALALRSSGGLVAHYGFGLMAACWLGTTFAAYLSIRKGDVMAHRAWMLRSYALTLAGVTLRIYLGIGTAIGTSFADLYPVLSWICWVPNLLVVEWFLLDRGRSVSPA